MENKTYSTFEAMGECYKYTDKYFVNDDYIMNYENNGNKYTVVIKNSNLVVPLQNVFHLKWTIKPKIEYHDTAVKHMLKGHFAEFEGDTWHFEEYSETSYLTNASDNEALLERKHFTEKKWILL